MNARNLFSLFDTLRQQSLPNMILALGKTLRCKWLQTMQHPEFNEKKKLGMYTLFSHEMIENKTSWITTVQYNLF